MSFIWTTDFLWDWLTKMILVHPKRGIIFGWIWKTTKLYCLFFLFLSFFSIRVRDNKDKIQYIAWFLVLCCIYRINLLIIIVWSNFWLFSIAPYKVIAFQTLRRLLIILLYIFIDFLEWFHCFFYILLTK